VAGHRGMVGSAIVRYLQAKGFGNIVTRTHAELDLTNQQAVEQFFQKERPEQVYLAAAKVGGIHANNTYPAEFSDENLMMEANVIHQAFQSGVKKLLFLGSSCIYPKLAAQPMTEDALLTGKLEVTNEPYAIAKIAGIKLCESYNRQYGQSHGIDYRSVMPTNLYGPGDNYHPENSHVIPALIRRFHEAKEKESPQVIIWGTGTPMREFLYVDDCCKCFNILMNKFTEIDKKIIDISSFQWVKIKDIAKIIALNFNNCHIYPGYAEDDIQRKAIKEPEKDIIKYWQPETSIEEGVKKIINLL
jgi:GDP-L-fucose synthase